MERRFILYSKSFFIIKLFTLLTILQHFLAMPFFLFFYKDLSNQVIAYNKSPLQPVSIILEQIPVMGAAANLMPDSIMSILGAFQVHKLWAFLFMNVVTQ